MDEREQSITADITYFYIHINHSSLEYQIISCVDDALIQICFKSVYDKCNMLRGMVDGLISKLSNFISMNKKSNKLLGMNKEILL